MQHPDKSLSPLLPRLPPSPFYGEIWEVPQIWEGRRRRGLKVGKFGGWRGCRRLGRNRLSEHTMVGTSAILDEEPLWGDQAKDPASLRRLKRKVEVVRVCNPKRLDMGLIHWFCSEWLRVLPVNGKKRERTGKLAFIRQTTHQARHQALTIDPCLILHL